MDSQAPPSLASGVAASGGADMLRRAWSEVVATVTPERTDIVGLLGGRLDGLEAAGRLDEESLIGLAEEAAEAFRADGPVDVARVLSKRLRRAVYEFLLALDATPAEPAPAPATAPASDPAGLDRGFVIGLEEVEAQGRPMRLTTAGADEAALAELARLGSESDPAADVLSAELAALVPAEEIDDDGVNALVEAADAEAWSRAAEERFAEIEGHAMVVDVAFPPLELDAPLDTAAPADEPLPPPSLTPSVDNEIPITRREDFVVSDPTAISEDISITRREDFVVTDPTAIPAAQSPAPRPEPPAELDEPGYPAAAEWLPAEQDLRLQAEQDLRPPEPRDPLLAGWSTVTIDSDYDPTPSFPSSRFDPRADQGGPRPGPGRTQPGGAAGSRRQPPADAGFLPVVPGSMANPQAWGLRSSPRQSVLADRMARKRREEAVRAAYEAAQLAATLGEPDRRRKRRSTDLERLPDVEGLRSLVEDLLKRKKGAQAGSLLQRAAQEQGGREVADLCIDAGDRCRALGQSRAATNCYLAAWRADPVYEAPLWRLSDLCLSDREVDLAVGYLERIAALMRTRGDDEGALGVYRKIVTVAPDRSDIRDIVRLAQTTGRLV